MNLGNQNKNGNWFGPPYIGDHNPVFANLFFVRTGLLQFCRCGSAIYMAQNTPKKTGLNRFAAVFSVSNWIAPVLSLWFSDLRGFGTNAEVQP